MSGALSDLLHAGMTAMQARAAQRRCIPASPDNGPRSACMKAGAHLARLPACMFAIIDSSALLGFAYQGCILCHAN